MTSLSLKLKMAFLNVTLSFIPSCVSEKLLQQYNNITRNTINLFFLQLTGYILGLMMDSYDSNLIQYHIMEG